MNIKSALKKFVFGEDEKAIQQSPSKHRKGKIHIITPDGRVELVADFENKADFDRIKYFVNHEDTILFSEEYFDG